MVTVEDIINETYPTTVTSGDDLLAQFRTNLELKLGTLAPIQLFINSVISNTNKIWNRGVIQGLTVGENLAFTKTELLKLVEKSRTGAITGPLEDFILGVTAIVEGPAKAVGAVGEVIEDIITVATLPIKVFEFLRDNWVWIAVAIIIVIIIAIITFSIFVTQPLMEAVMIGALS